MRFLYLELNNYIGIYNGMGLYKVSIDFSLGTHRVCVIKGTNGSGKSTIMNALSLFPDGTTAFIPDLPASKIIRVSHKTDVYEIKFYHDVKQSGTRETTKAYIAKLNEAGNFIELNPNGNVTQYKDILYDVFKLDPNFFALSKLSMDDRGLGYKKPAERKKFVNSIIESLEVYNDIYKNISKKSNAAKAVMASITTKLGSIGDRISIESLKDSVEVDIRKIQESINVLRAEVTKLDLSIQTLDPDSSIQQASKAASNALKAVDAELKKRIYAYHSNSPLFIPEVEAKYLGEELVRIGDDLKYFNTESEKMRVLNNSLIDQIANIHKQLEAVTSQLSSMKTDDYIETETALEEAKKQAEEIKKIISVTGIDPRAFTKDEYIMALNTVHEITQLVDIFRSQFDYDMINNCVHLYSTNYDVMPPLLDYATDTAFVADRDQRIEEYNQLIAKAQADLQMIKMLNNRPSNCKIDSCYFIKDAVEAFNRKPEETLTKLNAEYAEYRSKLEAAYKNIEFCEKHNACMNSIRVIIRSIDKNSSILSRLPNGGIFNSKNEFFEYLLGGNSFVFIDRIYQYIDLANYFEQYRIIESNIARYEALLYSLSSKKESMKKFEDMKNELLASVDRLNTRLEANRHVVESLERSIQLATSRLEEVAHSKIPECDRIIELIKQKTEFTEQLKTLKDQMKSIDSYLTTKFDKMTDLKVLENNKLLKEKERDALVYKLGQIEEYENSLKEYESKIQMLEKIKYHSSPTTGIQLVFMQLYMGKILMLSNELLGYLFGGQYQLQPFVINEDEFKIPCIGNGYLNDDISSMSSSQLTMISMILSFALLTISSTEYNVIKLDEIDDPLDEPNRAAFALLLDNIMDVMHTEQCIMISHSSEMIISNADVVLLRSDGLAVVEESNNIIWNFMQQ